MYEEIIEVGGVEYEVGHDIDATDPREYWDDVEIASVRGDGGYTVDEGGSALFDVFHTLYHGGALPYRDGAYGYGEITDYSSPRDDYDTDEEFEENASDAEKLAVELFDEFYDLGEDVSDVVDFVNKLNDAFDFDPGEKLQYAMIRGYSQSDWGEYIVAGPSSTDLAPYIEEFRMWAFGDVWFVSNGVDAVGGIYADSAEEAVQFFIDSGY